MVKGRIPGQKKEIAGGGSKREGIKEGGDHKKQGIQGKLNRPEKLQTPGW